MLEALHLELFSRLVVFLQVGQVQLVVEYVLLLDTLGDRVAKKVLVSSVSVNLQIG